MKLNPSTWLKLLPAYIIIAFLIAATAYAFDKVDFIHQTAINKNAHLPSPPPIQTPAYTDTPTHPITHNPSQPATAPKPINQTPFATQRPNTPTHPVDRHLQSSATPTPKKEQINAQSKQAQSNESDLKPTPPPTIPQESTHQSKQLAGNQ